MGAHPTDLPAAEAEHQRNSSLRLRLLAILRRAIAVRKKYRQVLSHLAKPPRKQS